MCGLAADLGVGVHIHVAEAPMRRRRREPPRRADRPTGCSPTPCTSTAPLPGTVVHNPRSNLNNAVGYGRPARFAPVALGTDGIGADMLDEFRLAFALAPGRTT